MLNRNFNGLFFRLILIILVLAQALFLHAESAELPPDVGVSPTTVEVLTGATVYADISGGTPPYALSASWFKGSDVCTGISGGTPTNNGTRFPLTFQCNRLTSGDGSSPEIEATVTDASTPAKSATKKFTITVTNNKPPLSMVSTTLEREIYISAPSTNYFMMVETQYPITGGYPPYQQSFQSITGNNDGSGNQICSMSSWGCSEAGGTGSCTFQVGCTEPTTLSFNLAVTDALGQMAIRPFRYPVTVPPLDAKLPSEYAAYRNFARTISPESVSGGGGTYVYEWSFEPANPLDCSFISGSNTAQTSSVYSPTIKCMKMNCSDEQCSSVNTEQSMKLVVRDPKYGEVIARTAPLKVKPNILKVAFESCFDSDCIYPNPTMKLVKGEPTPVATVVTPTNPFQRAFTYKWYLTMTNTPKCGFTNEQGLNPEEKSSAKENIVTCLDLGLAEIELTVEDPKGGADKVETTTKIESKKYEPFSNLVLNYAPDPVPKNTDTYWNFNVEGGLRRKKYNWSVTAGANEAQCSFGGSSTSTLRNPVTRCSTADKDSTVQLTLNDTRSTITQGLTFHVKKSSLTVKITSGGKDSPFPAKPGEEITLVGSASGGSGNYTYAWDIPLSEGDNQANCKMVGSNAGTSAVIKCTRSGNSQVNLTAMDNWEAGERTTASAIIASAQDYLGIAVSVPKSEFVKQPESGTGSSSDDSTTIRLSQWISPKVVVTKYYTPIEKANFTVTLTKAGGTPVTVYPKSGSLGVVRFDPSAKAPQSVTIFIPPINTNTLEPGIYEIEASITETFYKESNLANNTSSVQVTVNLSKQRARVPELPELLVLLIPFAVILIMIRGGRGNVGTGCKSDSTKTE